MPAKIRVLFDATLLTKQKTGIGFYAENLLQTLLKNYPDEVVLTGYYFDFLGRSGVLPTALKGITYKKIRWFPIKIQSLSRKLGFQIPLNIIYPKSYKFDVIIWPDFVRLRSFAKVPSCVFIYDLCFVDCPEFVSNANAKFLRRFVPDSVKKASGIISISEFTKKRIVEVFGVDPKSVAVVPPGVVAANVPARRSPKSSPVLYVGTIEPRKNLKNLLLAYSKLSRDLQRLHPLVIVGGKGWKDETILGTLETFKNRGVLIEHKGYVSQAEKARLYSAASVVALISHYEGFGMQILEAMSYNVPLLLSNIPVFHEVAEGAAYYCNKDDPEQIATQLERILTSTTDATDKKLQLYPTVLKKFTWDESANTLMQALRNFSKKA